LDQFKGLKGYYVYLLWGEDSPIYVGLSIRLHTRLSQHMADPEKRSLTRRIEVIECVDEAEMRAVEDRLIHQYRPRFNRAGVVQGVRSVPRCRTLRAARSR